MGADAFPATDPEQPECPFVVEHLRPPASGNEAFVPRARLILDRSLRTSGLLLALPAEELKSLLFLLSFLHANGACSPSVPELAQAMRLSQGKVRARLRRLTETVWQEHPVAIEIRRESGLDSFSVSPHLMRHVTPPEPEPQDDRLTIQSVGRDAVIAHSRELYSRPRAEVEREIAERMGWPDPGMMDDNAVAEDNPSTKTLYSRLVRLGVRVDIINELLERHEPDHIRKQLDWLPFRNPMRPERLIVTAIEENYEEPLVLRLRSGRHEAGEVTQQSDPTQNQGV